MNTVFFTIAAPRWWIDMSLTPSFFSVSSSGWCRETPHGLKNPGKGQPMLKKKKWTSYEKKDSLFRLHPLFSWQSAGQRSPSSNVPCPLHLPVASHLSLPPLLYSISIKASLTLDGEDAVCLYFVVDVVVVVFEVNCWLVLFFFCWKYGPFWILSSGRVRACALAWLYPGLSRGDMRGGANVFFFFFYSLNLIWS